MKSFLASSNGANTSACTGPSKAALRSLSLAGEAQRSSPCLSRIRGETGAALANDPRLPVAQEVHMPPIFVNTDHGLKNKLYNGTKAGKAAAAAEGKMQRVVKRIIDKAAGFTTIQSGQAKGYVIRLEVSKVEMAGHQTKCGLSGSIVRYPPTATRERGKGEEMVSTNMTGNATADGTSEGSLLDCIEAIAEDLVSKSIPIMRADYLKR
jgi:hypothetical protein